MLQIFSTWNNACGTRLITDRRTVWRSQSSFEWFDRRHKYTYQRSLCFELELNTVGLLSVPPPPPRDKNLKGLISGERGGCYLGTSASNCLRKHKHTYTKCLRVLVWRNSLLKFVHVFQIHPVQYTCKHISSPISMLPLLFTARDVGVPDIVSQIQPH
jgi:hypothetical protein